MLGVSSLAHAGTFYCSDYAGVIDGFDSATYAYISSTNNTLGIDMNCTIKNWPQDNGIGGFPITNINYWFPGGADYYIVFDNVYYPGNMSCNDPSNSNFWIYWAPGSFNNISSQCQDFMVPVDMAIKTNPSAQTTATIGVPFTYTITAPKLGAWNVDTATFSQIAEYDTHAALDNLVIVDDLTQTGASLSYVSNTAYLVDAVNGTRTLLNGGLPLNLGVSNAWLTAHPGVTSDSTKHLVFSYENNPTIAALGHLPSGSRIDIELTVVLDDVAGNTPGLAFTNTSDMWFDKIIEYTRADGTTGTTPMTDLQAWPGTTLPMTIVEPDLVVNKSSPTTNLNAGTLAPFTIDVQNVGGTDAWQATIADVVPAGMCQHNDPLTSLTATLYAADGTTPINDFGLVDGLLVPGTDYTLSWTGTSTTTTDCQLTLTMLDTSAVHIGPNQHLIINYDAQLDSGTAPGLTLTNIAAASEWFNDVSTNTTRQTYTCTPQPYTGTVGTADCQDAYSLTSATTGYFFLKTVQDLTTGVYPATTVFPGDTLRYTLQLQNFQVPTLNGITITDDLGSLTSGGFVSGISVVAGSNTFPVTPTVCASCGTGGAPQIILSGFDLPGDTQYEVQFDVTLSSGLTDGTNVDNRATLESTTYPATVYVSDDPYTTGPAVLSTSADDTRVTVQKAGALSKANPTPASAAIGQTFTYTVTVPSAAINTPLYDVHVLDDLTTGGAEMFLVGASAHLESGAQSWSSLSNMGADASHLDLYDAATGIDIPANDRAIVEITVALTNNTTNIKDNTFTNTASYTYNKINAGDATTELTGGGDTTASMIILEPVLSASKTVSYASPAAQAITVPAQVGDVLQYQITVPNSATISTATAFDTTVVDTLPSNVALQGTPTAQIGATTITDFTYDATTNTLTWGNSGTIDIPVGQSLVVTYQVSVLAVDGSPITNSAYVDWTSVDGADPYERTGLGCPTTTAPNTYCVPPVSATAVPTYDPAAISKAVIADSWASGLSTAGDATVRVGDTVDYRLTLNLHEGLTQAVTIADTLPSGLAFDSVLSINGDTSAPYSQAGVFTYSDIPAASVPAQGQTGALTWSLGDITNLADNNPANDTLVIEYRARVVKDTIAQASTTTLTNDVALTYTGYDPASTNLASSATITVQQPVLSTPSKTASGFTSPANVNIVSDVMPFHLESCNNGSAPAYNVALTDQLAWELDETSITTPAVAVGGTPLNAGVDYTYTAPSARAGSMIFALNTPVNPAECVTIDYSIGFHADVAPNQTWDNSVTLDEYWSLTTPTTVGQQYAPLGPTTFTMTNPITVQPLSKVVTSPASGEVTIGEEAVYQITVPSTPVNAALSNVVVSDTLNAALEYVSASAVDGGGNPITLTDNSVAPGSVSLVIAQIAAGEQAIITLHTRVANNGAANAGLSFTNTASYSYTGIPGGALTSDTSTALTIVEPLVSISKSVSPTTGPNAGDTLTYTVGLTAQSGADKSNAYDLVLSDTLGTGLSYIPGSSTVNGSAVPDPAISAQSLTWPARDIAEGATVTVTYQVSVLNSVTAGQTLSNSATARWTGISGASTYERNGSGTPADNDYFATASTSLTVGDNTSLSKSYVSDTYADGSPNLRIGDLVEYQLTLGLQEGTTTGVVLSDTLPMGMGYDSLVSISPASGSSNFTYTVASQPTAGATGTLTWNLGTVVNAGDNNPANDFLLITYRARVQNNDVLAQTPTTQTLTNNAALNYTVGGVAATPKSANASVYAVQPNLAVSKSAAPAGGDAVINAGETINYTINITNTGAAPAYDTVLVDTLPLGLRQGGVSTSSITLVTAGTSLPNLNPSYNAATGTATWNFDTGVANAYTIPAGETLRVVYQVTADAGLGAGINLTNSAVASLYYSFDNNAIPSGSAAGNREVYGPSNTATTTLTSAVPGALQKATTQPSAAIGEQFTYRITVPAAASATALYDVRITDDLTASAADLSFVSVSKVSGSQPWTPLNTGDAKHLVIEDTTNGIDIPAGEQVQIDITVELDNSATNVSNLVFNNTANYTYDSLNNNAATQVTGQPGTSGNMTIAGPDTLTMEKSGPATMRLGLPATFTLNVQNSGTATAWDVTIVDKLPNPTPGGMCDTPPANIAARVYQANGTTPVSPVLTQGSDYAVSFAAAPSCTLTLTMQSAAAAIGAGERLIVTYDASLDVDNVGGLSLTNIAAATEWFSGDTAGAGATGAIRTYTGTLSDGTEGTLDEQDAYTLITESPVLVFQKSVVNVTSGQNPGANAHPGDTLRYTLHIENVSPVSLPDFSIADELDALNASALFVPGSLHIVSTLPSGADSSNTNASGGAKGSGLLDVRHLSLDAQGGSNTTLDISFEATLVPVIDSGTVVLNQAHMSSYGFAIGDSDDPNVNGADDPNVTGDEDPTQTLIASAPVFDVWKTSTDITGDPAVLAAGDTLRYTVTVKNIGNENATGVKLSDIIPAYTTYVANSTSLNGNAVTDTSAGVSPLQNGMLINAPEDTTPGAMRADASATTTNIATVSFDVVVNSTTVGGTVISNQALVNGNGAGSSGAVAETPSDNPATTTVDDPTLDVVGNLPLIDVQKTVQLQTDNNGNGYVDPDDVLRYTMTVNNLGAIEATGVTLVDAVPADTTFVPGSVTLNGTAVADSGVSPLIAGMAVNSAGAAAGVITAGQSATVSFDVTVNTGTAAGTIISNQGTVSSNELPDEPTDADGIDSNGDQPTNIVVGNVQLLSITKEVFDLNGGNALAGDELEYVVRVQNIGSIPATNVLITDSLASQLHYTANSATLNGSTSGVSYTVPVVSADYASAYGDLAPGETAVLRFRAIIDASQTLGTPISNTAVVSWNVATQSDSATVSFQVGAPPTGAGSVTGTAWHDANYDHLPNTGEPLLAGWTAELYRNNNLIGSVTTDANGQYQFSGLAANDTTADEYSIHFVAPGAGSNTALLGMADSPYSNELQAINQIKVSSGSVAQGLNMPIMPDGVVYDSISRVPVAGATVAMLDAANQQPLPSSCFDDASQQNQVTATDGFYRFDINFSDPACPAGGDYLIRVTPPAAGYEQQTASQIIPPLSDVGAAAFSVPGCLGSTDDAIPATADICEVVALDAAPPTSVAARTAGTNYYLNLTLDNNLVPGESQLFNNHIPLDPVLDNVVAITKTAAKVNVSRSDMVPYTITVNNGYFVALQDLSIVDTFPPGFKYVKGSSRFDGQPLEPVSVGNQLRWDNIDLATDTQHTIRLVFIVGSGVSEGEYVNRAQVINTFTSGAVSGEATATVRVVPDPTFDCTDVIGKVFDDKNLNGYQDEGESGLPNVRLINARGLIITSDEYGRFHITCAVVPNESRGSNYILKLDDRSLPSGYRITTENPRVQRATRGKMMKFNFGATIHHVVRLDVADGVFEPDSATMRKQWQPRVTLLLDELKKAPSVLRLSYLADVEDEGLVNERMDALKERVAEQWEALNCCYKLTIESEVYWRRGAPPERSGAID